MIEVSMNLATAMYTLEVTVVYMPWMVHQKAVLPIWGRLGAQLSHHMKDGKASRQESHKLCSGNTEEVCPNA